MRLKQMKKTFLRHALPLIGWAIALQLLFDGPWIPHRIDLYAILCYLLIVFGGQIIATDAKRIVEQLSLCKGGGDRIELILALRGIGTTILVMLEIGTTLWDLHVGAKGVHFPLAVRVAALLMTLPLFRYTGVLLLRRQDRLLIERRLAQQTGERL